MTASPLLEDFVEQLDETVTAQGMILVGHFVWTLRGMDRGLSDAQMESMSGQAYTILRRRYRSHLVWSAWPTNLATARPADDSVPLEFDLDPDGPLDSPILVLVLED